MNDLHKHRVTSIEGEVVKPKYRYTAKNKQADTIVIDLLLTLHFRNDLIISPIHRSIVSNCQNAQAKGPNSS
jgi:hypothetical protein